MNKGMRDAGWKALEYAVQRAATAVPPSRASRLLEELEAQGFTILPLDVRRSCDLFGNVAVTKTMDGYAVIDPKRWHLELHE